MQVAGSRSGSAGACAWVHVKHGCVVPVALLQEPWITDISAVQCSATNSEMWGEALGLQITLSSRFAALTLLPPICPSIAAMVKHNSYNRYNLTQVILRGAAAHDLQPQEVPIAACML